MKGNGFVYCRLTVSALSNPTQSPSPQSVNLPICVRIGPSATTWSSTYSLAVPMDSPYWPAPSRTNSTPSACGPGVSASEVRVCSGGMPRKL